MLNVISRRRSKPDRKPPHFETCSDSVPLRIENARWYNPVSQTWLSKDPTFPDSGSNPYEAFNNSPTNFIDPSGLQIDYGKWSDEPQLNGVVTETPPTLYVPSNPLDFGPVQNTPLGPELSESMAALVTADRNATAQGKTIKDIEADIAKIGQAEYNRESQQEKDSACPDPVFNFGPPAGLAIGNGQFKIDPKLSFNLNSRTGQFGLNVGVPLGNGITTTANVTDYVYPNENKFGGSIGVTANDGMLSGSFQLSETPKYTGSVTTQAMLIITAAPGVPERRP